MKTTIRPLRLTAATVVALVLMTGAAQARPLAINSGKAETTPTPLAYSGTYRPVAPANNVAAANAGLPPDRVDRIGTAQQRQASLGGGTVVVHTTTAKTGFDWTAALIGAGTALLVVLIVGAAGMTVRGRRNVAMSS